MVEHRIYVPEVTGSIPRCVYVRIKSCFGLSFSKILNSGGKMAKLVECRTHMLEVPNSVPSTTRARVVLLIFFSFHLSHVKLVSIK